MADVVVRARIPSRVVDLQIAVAERGAQNLGPMVLIADRSRAARSRYQFSVGRKPYVGSQPKVVVIVVGNSLAKNHLKNQIVFGAPPHTGKRSAVALHMILQIGYRGVWNHSANRAIDKCEV